MEDKDAYDRYDDAFVTYSNVVFAENGLQSEEQQRSKRVKLWKE
jgi:hypothetical protein